MTVLTDRFTRALDHARIAHAAQVQKGSGISYIYHPLAVASLVIEFGGDEDQAIAGLLHDIVEDCGEAHAAIVRAQFGNRVADIVMACTDGTAEGKAAYTDPEAKWRDWLHRKVTYLEHLSKASDDVLLVSACDKLHNARAIVQDLQSGHSVFERFTGGRDGTLAYYFSLAKVFAHRRLAVATPLTAIVGRMQELAGGLAPVLLNDLPGAKGFALQNLKGENHLVTPTRSAHPPKSKLQPFLDSGQMVESEDVDGIGFVPMDPPK